MNTTSKRLGSLDIALDSWLFKFGSDLTPTHLIGN